MPRKLFLHIGAHKTGTSAIQVACHKHLDKLHARNWDFAFKPGRPLNWGHAFEFGSDADGPYFRLGDGPLDVLCDVLANGQDNVILSAEDLFFLEGPEIRKLCARLADLFDEIALIVYLRRQDELAVSQKAQGAKTLQSAMVFGLSPHPLPELTPAVRSYLSFAQKLAHWQAALPGAALMLREYRRQVLRDGDIVADFGELLGLDLPGDTGDVNATLGANTVKLMLRLRQAGLMQRDLGNFLRSDWLEKDTHAHLPTETEARAFLAEFEADNAALAKIVDGGFRFHDDFGRYPENPLATEYMKYERRNLLRIIRHLTHTSNPDTATSLRNMALRLEQTHPNIARDLMALALEMKPHGTQIREQLNRMLEQAPQ